MSSYRIIISGGGTGGHIFPAIAIATTLIARYPGTEIIFTGADNRMEMERVPAAGFKIIGLPVSGLNRKNPFRNIKVILNLLKSISMAKKILREFKPDAVIGVGGYASGPTLWAATSLHIPTLIQEQNSYAGITNKLLGKRVDKICVAYEGMERFFPASKIVLTGNPVRKDLESGIHLKTDALEYFKLSPNRLTVLILGGSLGARTINTGIIRGLAQLIEADIQLIWQTGRIYHETIKGQLEGKDTRNQLWLSDFISRMDYAYAAADLVVSRAGAGTISELCLLRKASVLVPSPNVAEDHQTKNASAIVNRQAAVMIADKDAENQLSDCIMQMIRQPEQLESLSSNIGLLAQHRSAEHIVDEIIKIIKKDK
ncbi:MAG: undecaprenyldiphospho-muramoylpentapeptide beta-N-acetylglucosaminyltransferase [Tannerella sp.]|jgi:UDP-N-acetylglucosamine--N-acetylmuramyl-(pentapeptide) pyrophosphoryl-undecaprenol N-acetylglucosamine transferase|nr:undecaprenyldiphospho-muramoylpentapeptide beta-N-acetylglucosaminyltransferase [Tannerella sp.]